MPVDVLALPYAVAPAALAAFVTLYAALAPRFETEKARAYILSTMSSALMTLVSLPYLYLYLRYGLGGAWHGGRSGLLEPVGQSTCVFFGTYLFTDLALGYVMYPSQIGMLTGWVHHIAYIGIMAHLLVSGQHPVFLVASIMELPTFDLAISHLAPSVRHDARFLSVFFLTRILFHVCLLVDCLRPASRAVMGGSWVPAGILALALVLHVGWFRGGLAGHLKRRRALARQAAAATHLLDGSSVTAALGAEQPAAPAAAADASVVSQLSSPGTPDESPLLTPYTPSQTPLSVRDSYLFPTIAMPTLPLPAFPYLSDLTAALPLQKSGKNLPRLGHLNSAFKEAVKGRWEEQRERLAASGLNIGFGGLGLRRRTKVGVVQDDGDVVVHVEEVSD